MGKKWKNSLKGIILGLFILLTGLFVFSNNVNEVSASGTTYYIQFTNGTLSPGFDEAYDAVGGDIININNYNTKGTSLSVDFNGSYTVASGKSSNFTVPDGYKVKSISSGSYSINFTFELMSYTITYETNGGSLVTSGSGAALPDPLPVSAKDGYVLAGWYTDSDFTTEAEAGSSITADTTLYAKWTQVIKTQPSQDNDYTVMVDDSLTSSATYQWYKTTDVYLDNLTKAFIHSSFNNGDSPVYINISQGNRSETLLSSSLEEYLSLNVFVGSSPVTIVLQSEFDLTNDYLVSKDGFNYTFVINTAASMQFTNVNYPYDSITAEVISISSLGESLLSGETNAKLGTADIENASYYCKVYDASSNLISTSDRVTPNKAIFGADFDVSGTAPDAMYQLAGRKITLPSNTFTKEGCAFTGWNDGDATYEEGAEYTVSSDVAFTAVLEYIITYDTNGGSTVAGTAGTSLPDTLPVPTKDGYVFAGWYTDSALTTEAVAGRAITSAIILYAKWALPIKTQPSKDNDYTVVVDDSLTSSAAYQWYKIEKCFLTDLSAVFSNDDYINGNSPIWLDSSMITSNGGALNDATISIPSGGYYIYIVIYPEKTVTLVLESAATLDGYKTKNENQYTYEFSSNSRIRIESESAATVTVTSVIWDSDAEAFSGETNAKLGTAAIGNARYYCNVYDSSSNLIATSDKITTNKVTFAGGDGATGTTPNTMYQFAGRKITLPYNPFTKDGYNFAGWNDGDATYDEGAEYTVSSDVTFAAVWSEKMAVSITETAQSYTYTGNALEFEIKNTVLSGFTVEYYVENAWTENAPAEVGTYNVRVTRGEDYTYKAFRKELNGALEITKADAVITVDTTKITKTYGEAVVLPAAATTFGVVSCDKTSSDLVSVGTYTITYTVDGTDNYNGAIAALEVEITKNTTVITVDTAKITKTYGEEVTLPEAASNHGTPICDKTSSDLVNAGTYTVTYIVAEGDTYTAASVTLLVEITKAIPTITVDTAKITKTYGEEVTLPEASANSGDVTCDKLSSDLINAGTYTVTYTVAESDNYTAGTATLEVEITKAIPTITLDTAKITKTYGEAVTLPEASANSGDVSCDKTSSDLVNAGAYTVTYTVAESDNYTAASVTLEVEITKAQAIITVDTAKITKTYGEEVALPEATSNFGEVTCDKKASDLVNAGTYTVTYSVAGTDNYTGDTKTLEVVISKASQADVNADVETYPYGDENIAYALNGNYTVEYYVNDTWTEEAPVTPGSYDVRISIAEDENHVAYEKVIENGLVITNKTSLSGGAIAGITIGSFTGLLLVIYIFGYFFCYKRGLLEGKGLGIIYKWLSKGNKN